MKTFFPRFVPFLVIGIMFVLFLVGIYLLSLLLIFGAVIGLFLYAIAWIREFFHRRNDQHLEKKHHQTIDHK